MAGDLPNTAREEGVGTKGRQRLLLRFLPCAGGQYRHTRHFWRWSGRSLSSTRSAHTGYNSILIVGGTSSTTALALATLFEWVGW